jgi:hypothetical protein
MFAIIVSVANLLELIILASVKPSAQRIVIDAPYMNIANEIKRFISLK